MAKRKPKQIPPPPPRSAGEAVLFEATGRINDKTVASYVNGCFAPDKAKLSKRQKDQFLSALFDFAAVGWAFYCWSKYDTNPPAAPAAGRESE